MTSMLSLKIVAFATMTLSAFLLHWCSRGRPWERRLLRRMIVAATLLKLLACVLVYSFWPALVQYSDARNYYLP